MLSSVVDVGDIGGVLANVTGVNSSAEVVGQSWVNNSAPNNVGDYQAFFLDSNGVTHPVGPLPGGGNSFASAINDSGQIVGYSAGSTNGGGFPRGPDVAFIDSQGSLTALAPLSGGISIATAINSAGQVVGYSSTSTASDSPNHAVLWVQGNPVQDLGTLGGSSSEATGINGSCEIVGYSSTAPDAGSPLHAFLYANGAMVSLGTLPGSSDSYAMAINDSGQIVGDSTLPAASTAGDAFLYSNKSMTDLGVLPGFDASYATAINNVGQVVGYASYFGQGALGGTYTVNHAFIDSNGQMTDLNADLPANSGWVLNTATAINDQGVILGIGTYQGTTHGYLLYTSSPTPTPTPAPTPGPTPAPTPTPTPSPAPLPTPSPVPTSSPAPSPLPPTAPGPVGPAGRIHETRTVLTAKPRPAIFRRPVTLTAMIKNLGRSGGAPVGDVTFEDGAEVLGTVPLRQGRAALKTSGLPLGQNAIRVIYSGSENFAPSESRVVSEQITQAVTMSRAASSGRHVKPEHAAAFQVVASPAGFKARPATSSASNNGSTILGTADPDAGGMPSPSQRSLRRHSIRIVSGGHTRSVPPRKMVSQPNPSNSKPVKASENNGGGS